MTPADEGKLSKEEVDALLRATMETDEEPLGESTVEPTRRVQGYDFQQPSRFSKAALERLRRINSDVGSLAGIALAKLLRSNVKVQLVSMEQMKWRHLREEIGEGAGGVTFALVPLGHRGLVSIETQFAISCLERMMGGKSGDAEVAAGPISPVDIAVLKSFLACFLNPLPQVWANAGEFIVNQDDYTPDVHTLDVFADEEDFFELTFLLQTSVGSGQVALSVPFEVLRHLPEDDADDDAQHEETDEVAMRSKKANLGEVEIELTALLGTAEIKVARLVQAAPGDVIILDALLGEAVQVRLNDKIRLRGFPGLSNGKYALQLVTEG